MRPGDELCEVAILASHLTLGGAAVLGVVVEAGNRAGGHEGKIVVVGPFDPCGECDVCRRGGAAVCPQRVHRDALGDHVIAAGRYVVPIDDGLDLPNPGGAAVAGEVALAYALYARTGPAPRDPVVIVGASPIARFLVEILRAKGITPVVLADPARVEWCDWLRGKGATLAQDVDGVVAAIAGQSRAARVIVAATDSYAIARAAEITGPRSTLTVLAPVASLPGVIADREVTVIPVVGAHPDLIVEVAAMCTKGEIDLVGGTATTETADLRAIVRPR